MAEINWGALVQQRNPFDNFAEGMQGGAQMRMDRERQNLFAQEHAYKLEERKRALAEDQENRLERGIVGHMARTDPRGAQKKAVEVGQFDLAAEMGKLDESQRKAARENAEDLGGFASGLLSVPYEQRKGVIAQARPILIQKGFTEQQIDAFDPSDQGLQALVTSAMDLKTALEEANRQRDDKRQAETAAEARRHNSVLEKQGDARVGIARGQLGVSQSNAARGWAAHKERKRAGGYGTPGVGAAAIPDDDVEID